MSRSGDEELFTKIITYKLILAHRHVGKPAAVKLVVNAINIVWAAVALALGRLQGQKKPLDSHVFAHMSKNQFHLGISIQDTICNDSQDMHIEPIRIS